MKISTPSFLSILNDLIEDLAFINTNQKYQ